MTTSQQNIKPGRYQIVPRVLVFAWRDDELLLLKIKGKGQWDGRYNGLGGHIERGESALEAAKRELLEESGLQAELRLVGTVLIDTAETPGIGLFLFSGQALGGELRSSAEGQAAWVNLAELEKLPVLEDVPILLARILAMGPADGPFSARSFYDAAGVLRLVFAD